MSASVLFSRIDTCYHSAMIGRQEDLTRDGIRAALLGIRVNIVLAAVKGAAGYLGNSQALIADAVESATDIVGSLVVWTGLKLSARPADPNHPFGHGKAEPLAALFAALGLLWAAIHIANESVAQISTPGELPAPFTLGVLVAVVATKEILFRRVIKVGEKLHSAAIATDAWHHRSDALTSFAAFLGISIALAGGKGWESADDWAALFASCIIAWNAVRLSRISVRELMDHVPDPEVERDVRALATRVEGVLGLHRCYVRKMGLDYFVDLDVEVDPEIPVRVGHEIAHQVQEAVRSGMPRVLKVYVHIEPYERNRGRAPQIQEI